MTRFQEVKSDSEIEMVVGLAREIWEEHYTPIIGRAQVDYMLDRFQSPSAISQQLSEGYEYRLAMIDEVPAGYFAFAPGTDSSTLMLSKIYVRASLRGLGLGRDMLVLTEKLCRDRNISTIWLTVNRDNSTSIAWYERQGFRKTAEPITDIGHGFVMDDYRMAKHLT